MATVDPNIALSVKPLQIENPINQYAAMSQIQNAQNQNALAQYQLSSAKRGDEKVNFLNQSISKNTNPETGKIDYAAVSRDAAQNNFGSIIPDLVTQQRAEQAADVKLKTDTTDLIGKKLLGVQKLYGEIDPKDPNAPMRYLSIHDSVHKDADLGPYLKSLGVDQSKARQSIDAALKTPGGFEKLLMQSQMGAKDTYDHVEKLRHNLKTENISQQQANTSAFSAATQAKSVANAADPVLQASLAEAKAKGEFFGKNKAAAIVALPGAIASAKQTINLIDEMVGKAPVKDKNGKVIQEGTKPRAGFDQYVGFTLLPGQRFIEGSDAASFELRQKQIEGKAFLEAFETLKGGGSITEKEGEKGTAAIMRMNKASSKEEYIAAARELQDVLRIGVANKSIKAGVTGEAPNVSSSSDSVDANNPLLAPPKKK